MTKHHVPVAPDIDASVGNAYISVLPRALTPVPTPPGESLWSYTSQTIVTTPSDEFELSLGAVTIVRLVELRRDSPGGVRARGRTDMSVFPTLHIFVLRLWRKWWSITSQYPLISMLLHFDTEFLSSAKEPFIVVYVSIWICVMYILCWFKETIIFVWKKLKNV
jgi:hypothetical protein